MDNDPISVSELGLFSKNSTLGLWAASELTRPNCLWSEEHTHVYKCSSMLCSMKASLNFGSHYTIKLPLNYYFIITPSNTSHTAIMKSISILVLFISAAACATIGEFSSKAACDSPCSSRCNKSFACQESTPNGKGNGRFDCYCVSVAS